MREIVRDYPAGAREVAISEFLVAWAAAGSAGCAEEAAAALAAAGLVGRALAEKHADHLVADAVASVAVAASPQDSPGWELLAAGVTDYGAGLALSARQAYADAEARFATAEAALAAAGSPLAGLAAFHRAVCEYYRPDYAQAERSLVALQRRTDAERYPSLAALTLWMLGLCRYISATPTDSLAFYSDALTAFERAGYTEETARAEALIASAHGLVGQLDDAWRHRLRALESLARISKPRQLVSILGRAGNAVAEAGEPRAAVYFHNEAVAVADAWGTALDRAVAHHSRSRIRSQIGDRAGAEDDLADAWRLWGDISDPGLKASLRAEILRSEGDLPMDGDAQRVIESQSRSLNFFRATGKALYVADAYATRGRARLALGEEELAEADLCAGIAELERQRSEVPAEELQISFFALGKRQRMFDDLVELLALRRGRSDLTFDVAERGRARALFDRLTLVRPSGGKEDSMARRQAGASSRLGPPLTLDEVRGELPPKTALIFYAVLDRRLLAWVITPSESAFVPIEIGAAELAEKVGALRAALGDASRGTSFKAASGTVFDLAVRPALAAASDINYLVFVPDKSLHAVPFAALVDPDSGRYLVERYALSIAPSVRVYLRALRQSRRWGALPPASVLAMGDPAFDRRLFPRLPPLPRSEREVAAVAAFYPRSDLLTSDRADRESFLQLAGEFEVVHFSGHALASLDSLGYSALVLASADDDTGGGALYAHEIADLDLTASRLVTLGACDTGAGPYRGGEGILSLARALLAAGAPAVVQSLWAVEDQAAEELFRTFHTRLRAGADPAAALQAAQLALLRHPNERFHSPALWAGFAVIGGINPQPSNQR